RRLEHRGGRGRRHWRDLSNQGRHEPNRGRQDEGELGGAWHGRVLGWRSVDILTPARANRLGDRTLDLPSPSKVRRRPVSETLRSFRRNAVHVRQALELLQRDGGRLQVDSGYLTDEGLLERYKRLSIPVRRALNP